MAMPMQIGLDELLSMVMARLDGVAVNVENMKSKFNIMSRVLYKKGLISDEDILESIREEHRILKELGMIEELPSDEVLQSIADSILEWIKGDVDAIRKSMKDYEEKLRAMANEQAHKPKIDVASPAVLDQLDRMSGQSGKGGGKIIL
jgi:hypothetical protein